MPKNRAGVDRRVKLAQIIDAAEAALLGPRGYRDSTIAGIATQAGITTNSVHWYFPTKDDLLVAVLRRRLEEAVPRLLTEPLPPLPELLIAALHEMDRLASLTATVHDRAAHSPAVAEFHHRFHELTEHVVQEAFQRDGLAEDDAHTAAQALAALVEGLHLHNGQRDCENRDRLVLWALRRFTPS
ncbi:TetR/AcrR family transcriptional regulator [Mycobacterium marseillense]|uniref:TetR/AcrR family transcriptional regulator n=1 Tax=Mycobacterium marseillense TaxID=701042 RepID=UPI0015D3D188|nr:TetR/AcrR family transcriptional regulator [Mycobacterium marseillense]